MPRTAGSLNTTDYKYKVIDNGETKYYISQKEIQDEYDLKRTAVYFMLNYPERIKNGKDILIEKLPEPLPVYDVKKEIENDNIMIKYEKIIY